MLHQYAYAYDAAGNRTTEQIDGVAKGSTYNNLNQLTAQGGSTNMIFSGTISKYANVTVGGNAATLDASNNFRGTATVTSGTNNVPIVATDVDGNASTNTYQVVVPATTASYTYDLNGNLTYDGSRTFSWDAKNELVKITYADTSYSQFTYNGAGARVKIQEYDSSGTLTSTKQFVANEERDANNVTTKRFFSQGEQRIVSGTTTNYYYTFDHLGSIREMIGSDGVSLHQRYDYDPYGRRTKDAHNGSNDLDCDFGFTGHYWHAPSSLYLAPYRAYDPNLGRWIQRDPSGESSGLNLYAYCADNPVCNVDPLGLDDSNSLMGPDLSQDLSNLNSFVNSLPSPCMDAPPGNPLDPTADSPFGPTNNPVWMAMVQAMAAWYQSLIDDLNNASTSGEARSSLALTILGMASGDDELTIGEQIAGGHAFAKHAGEFGFTSADQMAQHIDSIIANPTMQKSLSNGRSAFWDAQSGTVVIVNPNAIDGGTAFIPKNGVNYFYNLK